VLNPLVAEIPLDASRVTFYSHHGCFKISVEASQKPVMELSFYLSGDPIRVLKRGKCGSIFRRVFATCGPKGIEKVPVKLFGTSPFQF
jgi:hypothetical protein